MPTTVFDPTTSTDTDLITHLVTTHDAFTQHHAGFIISLAEFNHRGLYRDCGAVSTTNWLGRRLNIARSTAYAYRQVSLTLTRFPQATDAFRTGALTYPQITLLCRYLTADNEADLVATAVALSVRELQLAPAGHPDTNSDSDGAGAGYLLDSGGVTVAMGRTRRLVTASQELAVLVAWLFQCAVPGCAHTRVLEVHHLLAWSQGGKDRCGELVAVVFGVSCVGDQWADPDYPGSGGCPPAGVRLC